jgi:DNA-directed RNA polymerase subunit beta'
VLCEWDPHHTRSSPRSRRHRPLRDMIEGETIRSSATPRQRIVVIEHKGDLHPQIIIEDEKGKISTSTRCPTKATSKSRTARRSWPARCSPRRRANRGGTQDITGGLPRVTELFEARKPKDPAVIAEIDGWSRSAEKKRGKRTIIVRAKVASRREHLVPHGKHLRVHRATASAGEPLVDGPLVPHDILRIRARSRAELPAARIQNVYRARAWHRRQAHRDHRRADAAQGEGRLDPGDTDLPAGRCGRQVPLPRGARALRS